MTQSASTTHPNATYPSAARRWLQLGVFSLVASGLPAILLVIARAGGLTAGGEDFSHAFHKALVIHVDLSVLVWFFTASFMIWSVAASRLKSWLSFPLLECAAWWSVATGALLMLLSPLAAGDALMSNYVPVLTNQLFFLGLMLIYCGAALMAVQLVTKKISFICHPRAGGDPVSHEKSIDSPWIPGQAGDDTLILSLGSITAAAITLLSLLMLPAAYHALPPQVFEATQYYDLLFWAFGHILQFSHTQMLMVAWLLMGLALLPGWRLSARVLILLFAIGAAAALVAPLGILLYDISEQGFRLFYTHHMIALGGIAPVLCAALIVRGMWKQGDKTPQQRGTLSALLCSILLFAYGGVLGLMIQGQNVIIPAHYHGSIVGITVAFMGLAVLWLPRLGGRALAHTKIAMLQPVFLTLGQIMHVTALAYLGGHGVARKTPGAPELPYGDLAVQVLRFGGLLAVLGGVLFVFLIWRGLRRSAT